MTEFSLNTELENLIKQTLNQDNQEQLEKMTATENHDEWAKSPNIFQYNNDIKKKERKKKLVSGHTRPQELNQ